MKPVLRSRRARRPSIRRLSDKCNVYAEKENTSAAVLSPDGDNGSGVGVFDTYEEGEETYAVIRDSELTKIT